MPDSGDDPVVVLTYRYSGTERLRDSLARDFDLACTSSTGLLPMCDFAASAWRTIDSRTAQSKLAVASIRSLANMMISTILASAGGTRWCEFAFASGEVAETFLSLYPDAKFICYHRNCFDVISSVMAENPWRLADVPFGRYADKFPGNAAAAIAAFWVASTGPLLRFEEAHPRSCTRILHEELAQARGHAEPVTDQIAAFLGLQRADPRGLWDRPPDHEADRSAIPPQESAGQLPPRLKERVEALHSQLGYPSAAG